MKFVPYSYFGGGSKKVKGTITNENNKVKWVLNGTWDSTLEGSRVVGESTTKGKSNLEIRDLCLEEARCFKCYQKGNLASLEFPEVKPGSKVVGMIGADLSFLTEALKNK